MCCASEAVKMIAWATYRGGGRRSPRGDGLEAAQLALEHEFCASMRRC